MEGTLIPPARTAPLAAPPEAPEHRAAADSLPAAAFPAPVVRLRWRWTIAAMLALLFLGVAIQYAQKVNRQGSAIVRWRPALVGIAAGENLYQTQSYPNPPILALLLHPFARLPVLPSALLWFAVKGALTIVAVSWALELVQEGRRPMPPWAEGLAVGLSLRPILSDLNHGNVNLLILFLVVAALRAFRAGRDRLSGLVLALAITCKVTPALLAAYFVYKRAWRLTTWCAVGLLLFLVVVPSVALGWSRNAELLADWYDLMIVRYVSEAYVDEVEQTNQSIPGLLTRLFSDVKSLAFEGEATQAVNVATLERPTLRGLIRGAALVVLVLLALACRTPLAPRRTHSCGLGWHWRPAHVFGLRWHRRPAGAHKIRGQDAPNSRDASADAVPASTPASHYDATGSRRRWALACEYGLILLAMLFLSERSWKHHYVTMLLPFAAVCYALSALRLSRAWKGYLAATLAASALLMATTSSELGPWLFGPMGHKYAQAYGAFLVAGLVLFAALFALLMRRPEASFCTASAAGGSAGSSRD